MVGGDALKEKRAMRKANKGRSLRIWKERKKEKFLNFARSKEKKGGGGVPKGKELTLLCERGKELAGSGTVVQEATVVLENVPVQCHCRLQRLERGACFPSHEKTRRHGKIGANGRKPGGVAVGLAWAVKRKRR